MKTINIARQLAIFASLATATHLHAQHYPAGSEGIKAGSIPAPGIYIQDYNSLYFSDNFQGPVAPYDPAWNPGDPNGLSYCGGDGINYADPDGRMGKGFLEADQNANDPETHAIHTGLAEGLANAWFSMAQLTTKATMQEFHLDDFNPVADFFFQDAHETVSSVFNAQTSGFNRPQGELYAWSGFASEMAPTIVPIGGAEVGAAKLSSFAAERFPILGENVTKWFGQWSSQGKTLFWHGSASGVARREASGILVDGAGNGGLNWVTSKQMNELGVFRWKIGGNNNVTLLPPGLVNKGGIEATYVLKPGEAAMFSRAWGTDFSWNPYQWWKGGVGQFYYRPGVATWSSRAGELGTAGAITGTLGGIGVIEYQQIGK